MWLIPKLNQAEGVGDTRPVETNLANKENTPKESKEELEKTKSVNIETNREDEEEENPSIAPLVDSIVAIPPTSTEPMIE
ncbi:hypothetical protein J1N35_034059 [Gossypium stocksii]|uniref:Uncharacterized protein n=1 Tax=Gossypium stocksii TaxID=47602 RepID=A0A9D3US69_9ROSI|nr:hypothetical protein J1N35_034059 [Gossypium stocksii]